MSADLDYRDRVFHIETLRGGMNRLLLRSNRNSQWRSRIEVLFMNVKFMKIGTQLDGLIVKDRGSIDHWQESVHWRVSALSELHIYDIESASGAGMVVAGSVTADSSEAGPDDPSHFFMMD